MGCEQERVVLLMQMQQETLSLEQPAVVEHDEYLLEAPNEYEQGERQAQVASLLRHLTTQEQRVAMWCYQLGTDAACGVEDIPLSYAEVDRHLGMTAALVKAIEGRAFVKMRFWAARGR